MKTIYKMQQETMAQRHRPTRDRISCRWAKYIYIYENWSEIQSNNTHVCIDATAWKEPKQSQLKFCWVFSSFICTLCAAAENPFD